MVVAVFINNYKAIAATAAFTGGLSVQSVKPCGFHNAVSECVESAVSGRAHTVHPIMRITPVFAILCVFITRGRLKFINRKYKFLHMLVLLLRRCFTVVHRHFIPHGTLRVIKPLCSRVYEYAESGQTCDNGG